MARVIVVSGGGTGIGLATARMFACDGERVALLGHRPDVLDAALREIDGAAGPEHVAQSIRYLASPEAEFVNGSVFMVDGGITSVI